MQCTAQAVLFSTIATFLGGTLARAEEPPKVHDPIQIGGVTIENRIARSSLAGITDGEFGEVNPQRVNFEENFAAGGVGLIISSHVPIRADGRVLPNYAMIDNDERIPEWRAVVEAVHRHGSKYFMQLSHSGRQQDMGGVQNLTWGKDQAGIDPRPPSPGSVPDAFHGLQGRKMSTAEMEQMVQDFVAAARRAARAGVDGLELHSSNGYFFTQVISSASNDRTDKYGGSLENRFRFWREVIQGIKNDPETRHLPLIVKLSVFEDGSALKFWKKKGNTIAESLQVAKWAEEAGADAIHVSAGDIFPHPRNPAGYLPTDQLKHSYAGLWSSGKNSKLNFALLQTAPDVMRLAWERRHWKQLYANFWDYLRGKQPDPAGADAAWRKLEGVLADHAALVKQSVKHIPVLVTGAWQSLGPIQRGLAAGKFDMVTSARTWLANPTLPRELVEASRQGKTEYEPKRPCTMCNRCLIMAPRTRVACQNPNRYSGHTIEERRQAMLEANKAIYSPVVFKAKAPR